MQPPSITVLQYNVLFANDSAQATPWEDRAAALRAWIEELDPDVVTLQEVTLGQRADGTEVDMLADILRGSALSHHVFGPACDDVMPSADPGQTDVVIGNAIASRWPISESEVRALSHFHEAGVFSSKRSAVWAHIESPHGPVGVTCTHLNSIAHHGANRADQMVEVLDLVKSRQQTKMVNLRLSPVGMPPILCGDMNAVGQSDEIRYACGHHAINGRTAPLQLHDAWASANPAGPEDTGWTMVPSDSMADKIGDHRIRYAYPKRIDYVFVGTPGADGAGHVLSCEVVGDDRFGTWPSDHLAVFARVRAPAPAPDAAAKL
jgi:endonuclease/exonuclease/phosphatase family metal-dependent hydrolase